MTKGLDVLVGTRFLAAKVVGRETYNNQLAFILLG
jgi:hypothetical protein